MSLSLPDWSITKKALAVSTSVRKDKNSPLRALLLAPASAHSAFPTVSRLPVFLQDDRPSRGCSCRHWPFHHGCPTLRQKASSQLLLGQRGGRPRWPRGEVSFMPEEDPPENVLQSTYGAWGGRLVGTEPGWKGWG